MIFPESINLHFNYKIKSQNNAVYKMKKHRGERDFDEHQITYKQYNEKA